MEGGAMAMKYFIKWEDKAIWSTRQGINSVIYECEDDKPVDEVINDFTKQYAPHPYALDVIVILEIQKV